MKLIPQAKPVKIRIKSGGEEHSSLDSLKRNFKINDIKPLLDGRLVRWLKQQGENELANVISEVDSDSLNTLQGVMNLMQIFFKDYLKANAIHDSLDLIKHWLNFSFYRKNGENLFYTIVWLLDDPVSLEICKYLYKHKEELNTPQLDWFLIFDLRIAENEDESDPEVLYLVGKMLWEGYQFNDLYPYHHYEDPNGLELIEKSARLGCQEANLFIFSYNRIHTERFARFNKGKLKEWINNKWETVNVLKFSPEDYVNEKERAILNFVCQCRALISYCANMSWDSTLQKASFYFFPEKNKQPNDILAKEKWFIIGLLQKIRGNSEMAKEAFNQAENYPPAQYMLSPKKLLNNIALKSMPFPSQVSYVVKCLFDYE